MNPERQSTLKNWNKSIGERCKNAGNLWQWIIWVQIFFPIVIMFFIWFSSRKSFEEEDSWRDAFPAKYFKWLSFEEIIQGKRWLWDAFPMQHDPTSLTCLMEERKWGQVSPMKMGSWCHVFLGKFGYTFPTKASISQWNIHEQFCVKSNHFINLPHLHFNPPMPHSSCTLNVVCMVLYACIASLFALGPSLLHKPSFHM